MVNVNGACLMIKLFTFLDVSIGFLKMNKAFKFHPLQQLEFESDV